MNIQAHQKYIRTSPRKIRVVVDGIRHLPPTEALRQLKFIRKRAATVLYQVINQAVSNATNNHKLSSDTLKFKTIEINEGPTYKRWQPVSRGRAHSIFKRTSHIKVVLTAKDTPTQVTAPTKPSTPVKPTTPTDKSKAKKS